MIFSFDLEKRVLSGMLQCQDSWGEVAAFLNDKDFYSVDSKVHVSIFKLLRNALNNTDKIDETILADRITKLGVSFPDDIDIREYIFSLSLFNIDPEVFVSSVKELKKYSARREIYDGCEKTKRFVKSVDPNLTYVEIVEGSDNIYHKGLQDFEFAGDKSINLLEQAEILVEERGDNPVEEFGVMSPYPSINKIYGSLFRPGNITTVVARAKVGKTTFTCDLGLKTCLKYNLPILHFDNGEMSEEELIFRLVSSLSGVPVFLLENGQWRTTGINGHSAERTVKFYPKIFFRCQNHYLIVLSI